MNPTKSVLIIEDDASMLWALQSLFKTNWKVLIARSKAEVKECAACVDLVISDYDVLGTDIKFEDTRDLCEQTGKTLILLSGRMEPLYKHQLDKPFKKAELMMLIKRLTGLEL